MMKYIKENWIFFAFMILICIVGGYFTTIYTLETFDQSMIEDTIKQAGSKEIVIIVSVFQVTLYAVILGTIGLFLKNSQKLIKVSIAKYLKLCPDFNIAAINGR